MTSRRRADALLAALAALAALVNAGPLGAPGALAAGGGGDDDHRTVIRRTPSVETWAPPTAVIDRSAMSDAGADMSEALDAQPGMRVTRLGGPGSTATLSIRGSTAQQVRFFLGGIPLDGADGAPVDLGTLPLGPLDSIALYRGAAPVIYGASAIGGVVDLRPRRLRRRRFEVEVGGGSFGTRAARLFGGDGGPGWGAAFAIDYLGTMGDFPYVDDSGTAWTRADDRAVRRANNRLDQASLMARGAFRLGDGVRLTLLDLFTTTDRGLPGLGTLQTAQSHLAVARNVAGARLEANLGAVQLALTPYLTWSFVALDDPRAEVGLGADRTRDEGVVAGVTAAARAPLELGDAVGITPLLTLAWRHERWAPRKLSGPAAGQRPSDRGVASAAAEVGLELVDLAAVLTGSGRLEATTDGGGGPSWGASLELAPADALHLSLRGYGGLRLPSLFERYGDTGYILGNADLLPERGLGLEARGKADPGLGLDLDGLWILEASVFATWLDDLIQYVQNAQGVCRPDNVATARIVGVELGTFADLFGHLRVRAGLTWLDAQDTSAVAARAGRQLPFRPELQAHLRLEGYHDLATAAVGEVGARLEIEHLSGAFLDAANLVAVPERLRLAVGAHALVADGRFRVDLALRNLTDERTQDLSGFPLPGRSLMVSLRWTPELIP
ncbi:MAG: hypothetical protein CSA66_05520 [Proteobacteria bacterium]|nr:MAG: hypothetical protein CSA66_05520 [Pseudomonadota bacterium]